MSPVDPESSFNFIRSRHSAFDMSGKQRLAAVCPLHKRLDLVLGASYECLEVGFSDDPKAMSLGDELLGLAVL